jgi:hypothetical protein
MNEYQKIKDKLAEILVPLGYSEGKADADRGPMSCIFSKGEKKFMVQWDAAEGMGSVEAWEGGDWNMLESIVPASADAEFAGHLNALCAELKSHL